MLGIPVQAVRAIGYGLLSLLLEVSTLGMVSLAQAVKRLPNEVLAAQTSGSTDLMDSDGERSWDDASRRSITRLTHDIVTGVMPPVLRRIRVADYALDVDVIRDILNSLYVAGVIETDKRNSFKLSESLTEFVSKKSISQPSSQ